MTKMIKNPKDLFNKAKKLKNDNGMIVTILGNVADVTTTNDIVGGCVQDWLEEWFKERCESLGATLIPNVNTQEFPDFKLKINNKYFPIDLKCYNYNNGPAFDIAGFSSFYTETYENPEKLFADYLIFSYKPIKNSGFKIENVFLKKLWELTGNSSKTNVSSPYIRMQVKRGQPQKIRPADFTKSSASLFSGPKELITAIKNSAKYFIKNSIQNNGKASISKNSLNDIDPDDWYKRVSKEIKHHN